MIVWLTGYSGSGKTTLAIALQKVLGPSILLDGDDLREVMRDSAFDKAAREAHIERTARLAVMISKQQGLPVIVALISPWRKGRDYGRFLADGFVEVWLNTPLLVCKKRDPKGLYKSGVIKNPEYEHPLDPEITITPDMAVEESVELINDQISIYRKMADAKTA